jgi:hypothetical protein
MAYTINLTDGAIFAVIPDGTINTSSSMVLVGKNYAGYGEFLDENFIHLLENSSNDTAPGAPLTGQLWWDSANDLLQVYNGSQWKTISAATASSTAPTSNVTGDLWYDTTNQLLKVYTGTTFLTVGPSVVSGTGAQAVNISDGVTSYPAIQFTVGNTILGIMSKASSYTPSPAISGFTTIKPGFQISDASASYLLQGTATNAQLLDSLDSTQFLRSDQSDSTSGALSVLNNTGLYVGVNSDLHVSVSGDDVTLANQTEDGDIIFNVNIGGTPTAVMTIDGATGNISGNQINANYADVAERFAADAEYAPGTVVSLGGVAEITKAQEELTENVFGVISTRAAYLMNSKAGPSTTHPPVAMTGRVPVRTIGTVRKGDRLVAAGDGLARSARPGEINAFNVIGRALEDKLTDLEGTVEAIVSIRN